MKQEPTTNVINVLFVTCHPKVKGGISTWVRTLQEYLSRRDDVKARYVYPAYREGEKNAAERSLFERIVGGFSRARSAYKSIIRDIQENKPDVIHITTSGQLAIIRDLAFMRAARKRGVKIIYHLHFGRVSELKEKGGLEWRLLKKALSKADWIIAIDPGTAETIGSIGFENKLSFVSNPVYVPAIESVDFETGEKEIVFIGWCVKTKGIEELLAAWARIASSNHEWILKIVGACDESYKAYLKKTFQCSRVVFEGEMDHDKAMSVLQKAKALVLPSYTEGLPYVVLEAMSWGKVVIATTVGAIPQAVGDCGILIQKESVEDVERALLAVIGNHFDVSAMGKRAYQRVRQIYSSDKIGSELVDIWKSTARGSS